MSGVSAGYLHTVGLHEDGTVVAVSDDSRGQCDVQSWTGITAIVAGTVVAAGDHTEQQCNVNAWATRPQMN